eukprot:scaffold175527_cov64-Attheya_sp.AAC.6
MCLWNIYDSATAEVFKEAVTAPELNPTWGCNGGALVDVKGYPLTQYYTLGDECVLQGPAPAFSQINQNTPTETVPVNLILQRWPTGPDKWIVESNPLYQYARSNVPIEDEELWVKPTIHAFDTRFFNTYDLLPNMLATAFRNTPHRETDYFRVGAEYYREPPNINGQFAALHHNFYAEIDRINVYDLNIVLLQHIINTYDYTHDHILQEMSKVDRMNHIDTAFLNCRDDKERTVLWTTMLPSLVNYVSVFCSVCCCRLPGFYFTKSQRHMKRTRQACCHCETNRQVKVAQVNRILGGLSYFVSPRQCARCLEYWCKHEFTNGHWKRTGVAHICRDCTM